MPEFRNTQKTPNPQVEGLKRTFGKVVNKNNIIWGAVLYAGLTLGFNAVRAIDVNNDIEDTVSRSAAAYYAAQTKNVDATIAVKISDISMGNNGSVFLDGDSKERAKTAYQNSKGLTTGWNEHADEIIEDVREERNNFAFKFEWNGHGADLVALGDRYQLKLLPATTAQSLPTMTIALDSQNKYSATVHLPPQWSDDQNTIAVTAFLENLKQRENTMSNDMTGTFIYGNQAGKPMVFEKKADATKAPGLTN